MQAFPATTPEQLAAVLRGRRMDRAMTQKQAGAMVGLFPKTISAIESRPERSSIASLFKLLSALDMELVLQPKIAATSPRSSGEW